MFSYYNFHCEHACCAVRAVPCVEAPLVNEEGPQECISVTLEAHRAARVTVPGPSVPPAGRDRYFVVPGCYDPLIASVRTACDHDNN